MSPDDYCQQKAAASGSSFYYSFMFLPPERRRAITALYAFCREVDDVVDECSEVELARVKLNWWREEVGRLFHDTPRHPVTQALVEPVKQFNLAEEYFMEIIDGMEMDLDKTRYASFKELSLYCYRAASVVGILSVEIFGYTDRRTLTYANDLGMAFQLTNILRDVREDAERGRIYIPADEMNEYGVSPSVITHSRTTQPLINLFEHQAERAKRYYASAMDNLPDADRYNQRAGLIMAAIYRKLLDEIEADGYRVLEHRVRLTPLRKLWIAWRTYHKEKKHRPRKNTE